MKEKKTGKKQIKKKKEKVNRIVGEHESEGMTRITSMETITSEKIGTDLAEDSRAPSNLDYRGGTLKNHAALASTELAKQAFS